MELFLDQFASPIGTIVLISDGEALRVLDFVDCEERMQRLLKVHYGSQPVIRSSENREIKQRVEAYFAGDFTGIDSIPVRTEGTPFQKSVWQRVAQHSGGLNLKLWRAGQTDRAAFRKQSCRLGEWFESYRYRRALPSRHRFYRCPYWLWRRNGTQTLAAGTRRRAALFGYTLDAWLKS